MTKQERINALEEILRKIRDGSTFGDCTPQSKDADTYPSWLAWKPSGDVLKLLRREPGW
jgi:hypothetical protein